MSAGGRRRYNIGQMPIETETPDTAETRLSKPQSPAGRSWAALGASLLALAASMISAAGIGSVHYSAHLVLRAALHGPPSAADTDQILLTVWQLRLPRIVISALVGASLAAAGVALQCLLRNDLSDPFVVGVSSGALVGAEAVLMEHREDALRGWAVPIAAFATGMAAIATVYGMARRRGRVAVTTLLLSGVIVSAFLGAVSTLLLQLGNPSDSFHILARLMGSLQDASMDQARWVGAVLAVCFLVLMAQAHAMNVFALGEEQAAQLGIETERFKSVLTISSALLTASSVAVAGVIGFVGLVVPHMSRRIAGTPDHRRVLPLATVLGAVLLVWADTLARSVMPNYQELPVGVITAFVGAPFFCYLLRRRVA